MTLRSVWFASYLAFVSVTTLTVETHAQQPQESVTEDVDIAADDKLIPRHWRLVWSSDPSHRVTVLWDTLDVGRQHMVTIRQWGNDATRTVLATTEEYAFIRPGKSRFHLHRAEVTDLEPSQRYELQFESSGQRSRWFYFDTAPSGNQSFSLIYGGDSRTGLETRKKVNRMISAVVEASWHTSDEADRIYGFAHGGDYVFTGTDPQQWFQWLEDHELTTGQDGRLIPLVPARGNHDRGRLFAQVFGFDVADGNYYGVSFGSMLRLVTLNTEASIAGDQAKWLQTELQTARSKHRWLVTQYHRPAYPAVKSPSGALTHWVPLFEKYNVDLVCEADGHNMKRTLPIRNGKHDPTGVVYVGEGGLGVPQRTPKTGRWFLRAPGFAGSGHHFQLLRFTSDELHVECRRLDGKTVDSSTRPARE